MTEYVYENAQGKQVVCGDYDFAARELLDRFGFVLVEVVDELLPDAEPEPVEDEPDAED